MENIIPVSDMRFYNKSLQDVSVGSPVILTKNGNAKYAVIDFDEFRMMQARVRLFEELQKGYHSLASEKTVSQDEFRKVFGIEK